MPKLTDMQAILLSTAVQRADSSLLPPPDTLGAITDRIRKAIETLIKRKLANEVEVATPERTWRSDSDISWGVVITHAGRVAIGVETVLKSADEYAAPVSSEPRPTKAAQVLALLRREQGATLSEMVAATGWQSHTTRAALTGLRKKGHIIAKGKRDDVTCYTIATAS